MSSVFRDLKTVVQATLQADPYFSSNNIPVLVRIAKQIASDIAYGIDPLNCGLAVTIGKLTANCKDPSVPGPNFDDVSLALQVQEQPTLNTTTSDADDCAENIFRILHLNQPYSDSQTIVIKDFKEYDDATYSVRQITLGTQVAFKTTNPTLPAPIITWNGTYTMSCSVPGAAIFYTLDGTYPSPRNPTSVLFQNAFFGPQADGIKAVAWLAGYNPSPVATH